MKPFAPVLATAHSISILRTGLKTPGVGRMEVGGAAVCVYAFDLCNQRVDVEYELRRGLGRGDLYHALNNCGISTPGECLR